MIRVNMVQDVEVISIKDKTGVVRQLKIFIKDDSMYIGPVQTLFDRNYILRDRHRIDFNSKLDMHQNELAHVSFILDKIDKFPDNSYFTKGQIFDMVIDFNVSSLELKKKTYTACEELFIEYGFNSMNFCLDRRGDIWVHYKQYEEQKQRKNILKALSREQQVQFDELYRKCFRFIRYVNIDKETNEIKCFALKSLNITKIYRWLTDMMLIHKVDYVSDIYNAAMLELEFHKPEDNDMCYKVQSDKDGIRLKDRVVTSNAI